MKTVLIVALLTACLLVGAPQASAVATYTVAPEVTFCSSGSVSNGTAQSCNGIYIHIET